MFVADRELLEGIFVVDSELNEDSFVADVFAAERELLEDRCLLLFSSTVLPMVVSESRPCELLLLLPCFSWAFDTDRGLLEAFMFVPLMFVALTTVLLFRCFSDDLLLSAFVFVPERCLGD